MSFKATTCTSRSPRLCLLLKTLLFLLCIYIKRVTATNLTSLETNLNSFAMATTGLKLTDNMNVPEQEPEAELNCPVHRAVQRGSTTALSKTEKGELKKFRNEIIENANITWLKNGLTLHRKSGNPVEFRPRDLVLKSVELSDDSEYTCLINYRLPPKSKYFKYLSIYPSISFYLHVIPLQHILPPTKPVVSHPPANILANRGDNVTFTCRGTDTMLTSTTLWFKSRSFRTPNRTFIDAFDKVANGTENFGILLPYKIKVGHQEEHKLHDVQDADIAYYGCVIYNAEGIDARLGSLDLLDKVFESRLNTSQSISILSSNITDLKPLQPVSTTNSTRPNVTIPSFPSLNVAPTVQEESDTTKIVILVLVLCLFCMAIALIIICLKHYKSPIKADKKHARLVPAPIVGIDDGNTRQNLPNGDCLDIYNIGKAADGFISGHLTQPSGHLMSQSISSQLLDKEKNPSISSNSSNSNSDEAFWGKSVSPNGDNSRSLYLHTSNTTTTTVPMYDHPPSTGTVQFCGAIVQDACVINPTYGLLRNLYSDSYWAFPRRNLERLNKIGEGQFGEVWRYIAHQKNGNENLVAVKQLKVRAGLGNRERLELIAEIEIMKSINNHPNVIKLLHYCADDYEPILLIMEYAELGKLQTYLRNCRSQRKLYNYVSETNSCITSKELIKFSYHIAKGMEYVASKGIIHRDLASRNILVSKDKVCKVADFGFARRISDDCAYERTTANPVPVKWMAPEALVENKFTSKSDVFSVGILMWEIVTLGATPYEYLTSPEVYNKVTSGGRLERPAHCKDEFFSIMDQCWSQDPAQRPTFKELAGMLEKLLLSENDYIELDQYPEHAYYNISNVAEKEVVHIAP